MRQIAIGRLFAAVLLVGAAVVQAGGCDNFKLQYYLLTRIFYGVADSWDESIFASLAPIGFHESVHPSFQQRLFYNQGRELGDLRKQNVNPEATTRIDLTQLLDDCSLKDEIPSIDEPIFDTAAPTPFQDDDLVVGMVINGEAKAYPFNVLNWHKIVNDVVGGVNMTVSYCPLCDTIVAFERGDTTFGV